MSDESQAPSGEEAASQLISLAEASRLSGLSAGHLRLLVNQGKLWGTKIGRNWVTTEQAVNAYLALDRRPGPKAENKPD